MSNAAADAIIDPVVDGTVIDNLLADLLINGPRKVEPSVRVLMSHDPIPSAYPDQDGDEPIERWCRLLPVRLDDLPSRRGAGDNDEQSFVCTISVGVSDEQMRSSPSRLSHTISLVKRAFNNASHQHPSTTHSLQITKVNSGIDTTGTAAASQTGSITISGFAQRVTGDEPSLTT